MAAADHAVDRIVHHSVIAEFDVQSLPHSRGPGPGRRDTEVVDAGHPQTNGICECFRKTTLQEFYQVTFRKKSCGDLNALQEQLNAWRLRYNEERTHQGEMCGGPTPREMFDDGMKIWVEKEDRRSRRFRPDPTSGSRSGSLSDQIAATPANRNEPAWSAKSLGSHARMLGMSV